MCPRQGKHAFHGICYGDLLGCSFIADISLIAPQADSRPNRQHRFRRNRPDSGIFPWSPLKRSHEHSGDFRFQDGTENVAGCSLPFCVITQEDIRRSGAANIRNLLRMVPGMDVSQINANTWAISARGFDDQFSNKLLVLIDGRTIISRRLAG